MNTVETLVGAGGYAGAVAALMSSPLWAAGMWQWTKARIAHGSVVPAVPELPPLFTTTPTKGQCPVCGTEDLDVRRLLNVPGGHDYVVPYGPWEAHYECSVTRPYANDARSAAGRPADACTCPGCVPAVDTMGAQLQEMLRHPDPTVRERVFNALTKVVDTPRVSQQSLADDIATLTPRPRECESCYVGMAGDAGLCSACFRQQTASSRAAGKLTIPLGLNVDTSQAIRDAALADHAMGRHGDLVPGCAACTAIKRGVRSFPPTGDLAWSAWSEAGFTWAAAMAWYQDGFPVAVAEQWRATGAQGPGDVPERIRRAWSGE